VLPDAGPRLTRRRQEDAATTRGVPGQRTAPARRILVIDDERGIRSLTARALTPAGFTVALAATGRQGLSIALRQPCDLVVLDLHLPDLDGEELLRQLRRERPRQAILVWSATVDRHAASRCRSLGACGYLAKPFTLTELIQSITDTCPQPQPS
jgi:DNA-binding response OmpR family regulator